MEAELGVYCGSVDQSRDGRRDITGAPILLGPLEVPLDGDPEDVKIPGAGVRDCGGWGDARPVPVVWFTWESQLKHTPSHASAERC